MLDQKTTTAPFFPLRQSARLRRPSPEISGRLKSGTARPISCFSRTGVADIEWDNCNAVGGRVDSRKTLGMVKRVIVPDLCTATDTASNKFLVAREVPDGRPIRGAGLCA